MKAKDLAKILERGESITGMYLVPNEYICAGFVPGSGGSMKIWGYYPYQILGFGIKPAGKIQLRVSIVNKLGTVYEHNDFLTHGKESKLDWNKDYEFFETEEEAIQECHLRNRGKKGSSPCHNYDLTIIDPSEKDYAATKFY